MTLRVRAVDLAAETKQGEFGDRLDFQPGLNVILADNTRGKSTLVQSIIYGLGLEKMLSPRRDVPLPRVMTVELPGAGRRTRDSDFGLSRASKYPPAKPGALVVSRSKRHDVTATRSLAPPKGGYSSNRSCSSRRSSRSCCWTYSRTTRSSCPTVET